MEEQKPNFWASTRAKMGCQLSQIGGLHLGPKNGFQNGPLSQIKREEERIIKKTIIIIAITIKKIQIKDDRNKYDMIFNYEQK